MEPTKIDPQNVVSTTNSLVGTIPGLMPPNFLPQQLVITGSQKKDCVRLRGLPYESQVHYLSRDEIYN